MAETLDDFITKYKNTFVFINLNPSKQILAEFVNYDNNYIYFLSLDHGEIALKTKSAMEKIVIKFPQKGLYNTGDYLFSFFFRKPERQFKRSPCSQNSSLIQIGTREEQAINFQNLDDCFKATYPDNKLIAKVIVTKRGGVALNNKIGISIAGDGVYDLWYYNNIVGNIIDDKVVVHYLPLEQEIKDFFGDDLTWK